MKKLLRILHLEDKRSDSDMIKRELEKAGMLFEFLLVMNRKDFRKALSEFKPDIILSDYSLPSFNGEEAFDLKEKDYAGIPFIIVSGTIGEESAVELIKKGITDYALKDKLFVLPQKMERALRDTKKREENVKMTEQREFDKNNLDALINNTKDLMWSVDRNFNLITSNRPFEEASKANFGRIILRGESVLSIAQTPEMRNDFKRIYERAFSGEAFTETAYFNIPFEFWSEVSYCPIHKGSEIIGTACHSRDITASRLAEIKLQKSESRLKEAQAIFHIGNWELDFITQVHSWSDELYKILGITKEDAAPSTEFFLTFIHPDDREEVEQKVKDAFKSLKATSYNFRFIRKDGVIRYGYTERKFEFDENGKPTRLLGVVQDITNRKLREEEREKMVLNIIQHTKNLEQFASIVSHNLRAPVANILGLSNVLKTNVSESEKLMSQEYLFRATEQLDEVLKDLNKILDVRAEIDEFKETVNFGELVTSIESSIQNIVVKESVAIVTDFEAVNTVTTFKSYLYSIFYNLISNSIKYRKPGTDPLIKIRSEVIEERIRISFKDNGIGIDLTKHGTKVFGLYNRFHLSVKGKGLGLFMVKTQLETLGGSVRLESKPGEGAEFIIELPM